MSQISNARTIRSPRGADITARSWLTEAPMRMLMNNLDPEVAERPSPANWPVPVDAARAERTRATLRSVLEILLESVRK